MSITKTALYPLRFEPIFQYRLWGGRKLESILSVELPGTEPIGEAWILSDRDDHPSRVTSGPLAGKTIKELIEMSPEGMLGNLAKRTRRFPLLLKFLDATSMLSVQVHPTDDQKEYLPPGENGKTEAWLVLRADPGSSIYAGLKPGATPEALRELSSETADKYLASFQPAIGEGVFIPAGTVHALGGGVVVFEVQENSDVTFRLYDWDRVDPHTGKARELHVEQAIACINFGQGEIGPSTPVVESTGPVWEERLFSCEFFEVNRIAAEAPFKIGQSGRPTILVGIDGAGEVRYGNEPYPVRTGDVFMLAAELGECSYIPGEHNTILEVLIPEA
jgi:mannose-6-phosphate isomerase